MLKGLYIYFINLKQGFKVKESLPASHLDGSDDKKKHFVFYQVQLDLGMWVIVLQGPGIQGTFPLHGLYGQGVLQEGGDDQAL